MEFCLKCQFAEDGNSCWKGLLEIPICRMLQELVLEILSFGIVWNMRLEVVQKLIFVLARWSSRMFHWDSAPMLQVQVAEAMKTCSSLEEAWSVASMSDWKSSCKWDSISARWRVNSGLVGDLPQNKKSNFAHTFAFNTHTHVLV